MTTVTVSIVLHNSAPDIRACLAAVAGQVRQPDRVAILDNASVDGGLEVARRAMPDALFRRSDLNLGFAAGQNAAMRMAEADIHVTLNPDCLLAPDFVHRVVQALEADPTAGSLSGRLLRFRDEADASEQPLEEVSDDVLDSTGMVALRNRRVLDRGTAEPASGHYLVDEYVFGTSAAAGVYRRAMLEDVAYNGEVFDESFFAYREDVDLAWRAQLFGWRTRYAPAALARHRRRVAPGRRRRLPHFVNRISVANRWRMIAKNETWLGWRTDWPAIIGRDLGILAYAAVLEQRTVLAVADAIASRRELAAWRRFIQSGRRVAPSEMLAWFGRQSALPAPHLG